MCNQRYILVSKSIFIGSLQKNSQQFKMFFTRNTQPRTSEKITKVEVSDLKPEFQPVILHPQYDQIQRSVNSFNFTQLYEKFSKQLFPQTAPKDISRDVDLWTHTQIESLFKLYDYYGPQWKIMSQQMPIRTANNLKNRFYTVLRNLIKLLFRKKADICPKLSGEIPSKDLSRLYDGKQDYKQFKFLLAAILQEINYDLESPKIDSVVKTYSAEIIKVYKTIYGERAQFYYEKISNPPQNQVINKEEKTAIPLALPDSENKDAQMNDAHHKEQNKIVESIKLQPLQKNEVNYVLFFYYNPVQIYNQQFF